MGYRRNTEGHSLGTDQSSELDLDFNVLHLGSGLCLYGDTLGGGAVSINVVYRQFWQIYNSIVKPSYSIVKPSSSIVKPSCSIVKPSCSKQ